MEKNMKKTENISQNIFVKTTKQKSCNPLREEYQQCFEKVSKSLPAPSVRVSYEDE